MPYPRNCPACGSYDPESLHRQRFAVSDLYPIDGYDVVHCRRCGMLYADGIPTQAAMDRYYVSMTKYDHTFREGRQSESERSRMVPFAEFVRERVPLEARILDVGCSVGDLLGLLKASGFSRAEGLEPSPVAARIAEERHGVRVHCGLLGHKPADVPPYDALILSHVLEHVVDHGPFLEAVGSWLVPGGLVVTGVPDASLFVDTRNSPYQEFSIEHIQYFTSASAANLMRFHGFEEACPPRRYLSPHSVNLTTTCLVQAFRQVGRQGPITFDTTGKAAIMAYLRKSAREVENETAILASLRSSQEPIYVWGVGTMTLRMLENSPLAEANIVAFVDSDPKRRGRDLVGRPILAPERLENGSVPILISSWIHQNEIEKAIRETLSLSNPLIKLRAD